MMALLIISAIVIVLILIGSTGGRAVPPVPRPSAPRLPAPRRQAPLDPLIDPFLDPTIEPWAEEAPARRHSDELFIEPDDTPFEPGGGSFGGGGASGSWDVEPDNGDDGSDA